MGWFHVFKLLRSNGFHPNIFHLPKNLVVSSENPRKTKLVPEHQKK